MLAGFSDSSLSSWTFWLQFLGIAGALVVILSLLGMHLVSTEISARAHKMTAGFPTTAIPVEPRTTPAAVAPDPSSLKSVTKPLPVPAPVPREITEAQQTAFIAEVEDTPKRPLEVVISKESDAETQAYADQIRVMLVLAGYDCGTAVNRNSSTLSAKGLLIIVQDPARAPSFAGAIQGAFKAIGIDALGAKDANFRSDQVVVFVGGKK